MIMQMDIPQTWKKVRVSDIGTIITGNTPPKINKSNFGNHVPFVKPPELLNDIIQDVSDHLSKEGAAKARVVLPNSVLVSCIGNLGKTGINRFPVAFNQQINAIVPFNGINPLFIFYQA
jgi:type I restriction enzyme, S subunit